MTDPEKRMKQHYDAKALPEDRVQAILAAGRAAAVGRRQGAGGHRWLAWGWGMAGVAGLAVAGLFFMAARPDGVLPSPRQGQAEPAVVASAALEDVRRSVRQFFATPGYELDRVAADPGELVATLAAAGGPAVFPRVEAVAGLESFGCEVLTVSQAEAYLICFWVPGEAGGPEATPAGVAGDMPMDPMKKKMMMASGRQLLHLTVIRREDLRDAPAEDGGRTWRTEDGWAFASWTEGGMVVTASMQADEARLRGLLDG